MVLEAVCKVLNSEPAPELTGFEVRLGPSVELRNNLREIVRRWLDSGPNLSEMNWDLSFLDKQRFQDARDFGGGPTISPSVAMSLAITTLWYPTSGPRARLWLIPNQGDLEVAFGKPLRQTGPDGEETLSPDAAALTLFHLLTVTPGCEKIAGPCARAGCDRYYIKKRASQKVYCSRKCGNAATAVARTKERIEHERKDKIKRAKAAMKKWKSSATRQDWKHWVAEKTEIDPRFLTRAVNKRELVPSRKEK